MSNQKRYKNREIDRRHQELRGRLKDIQTNVDDLSQQVEEGFESSNHRLSKLERWRNYIGGALAVVGPLLFFILQQIISNAWF
jgi:uncharacterized protein (UPF0305 family)